MRSSMFFAIFLSGNVAAQATICRPYEYAELKDMREPVLVEKYCQYWHDRNAVAAQGMARIKAGAAPSRNYAAQVLAVTDRCEEEMDRVARILEAKFANKQPNCAAVNQ